MIFRSSNNKIISRRYKQAIWNATITAIKCMFNINWEHTFVSSTLPRNKLCFGGGGGLDQTQPPPPNHTLFSNQILKRYVICHSGLPPPRHSQHINNLIFLFFKVYIFRKLFEAGQSLSAVSRMIVTCSQRFEMMATDNGTWEKVQQTEGKD